MDSHSLRLARKLTPFLFPLSSRPAKTSEWTAPLEPPTQYSSDSSPSAFFAGGKTRLATRNTEALIATSNHREWVTKEIDPESSYVRNANAAVVCFMSKQNYQSNRRSPMRSGWRFRGPLFQIRGGKWMIMSCGGLNGTREFVTRIGREEMRGDRSVISADSRLPPMSMSNFFFFYVRPLKSPLPPSLRSLSVRLFLTPPPPSSSVYAWAPCISRYMSNKYVCVAVAAAIM